MKLSKLLPCLAASLVLSGCGSDDNNAKNENVSHLDPNNPMYLVKSTAWITDDGVSLHFLTDTLDENTVFDPDTALAIPEYTGIAIPEGYNPDNAFFVGMYSSSEFRRYTVSDTGVVSDYTTLDFSGVAGQTGRNLLRATQFMSPTKAYALDFAGLQVIAFNPTDMSILKTISLAEIAEESLPRRWAVFPTTDGDRFVATIGFYGQDWSDPGVTKVVIVDSADDSVVTDSVDNCSAVSGSAKDAAGNMYFASYDESALAYQQGRGEYAPCVIRILAGANEFDDSYLMNMQNLTNNNRMAMGAVTGNGDIGYSLIMSDVGQSMVKDETLAKHLRIPVWEFYSFDLTDSNATATKVEGITSTAGAEGISGGTISRILNGSFTHHELGDITWMAQIDVEETSSIYNSTNPATWSLISNTVPGQLEHVGRLR